MSPDNTRTLTPYQDALELLQTRSQLRRSKDHPTLQKKNYPNNLQMKEWLSMLGYEDTTHLNVIHITGSKGKGSTAAFTDSFIRAHHQRMRRPVKVGLYTSPHLITERERIRINFEPISEEVFTDAFNEVWTALRKSTNDEEDMPGYLQLLALISVHVFSKKAVDVAIYEVHAGGMKDATNIFDQPVVCGFTTIGMDHVKFLGGSIDTIALHKSGIMKLGRPAISVVQETRVEKILRTTAEKLPCPLEFINTYAELPQTRNDLPDVQKLNASLAIRLANIYLKSDNLTREDITVGLGSFAWPGRFQTMRMGHDHWYLDIAHNSISLPVALSWFKSKVQHQSGRGNRVLIFGHESIRDTLELIEIILQFCRETRFQFHTVILSSYQRCGVNTYEAEIDNHIHHWKTGDPSTELKQASSPGQAIRMVGQLRNGFPNSILVTGSTHLVGGALGSLQGANDEGANDEGANEEGANEEGANDEGLVGGATST